MFSYLIYKNRYDLYILQGIVFTNFILDFSEGIEGTCRHCVLLK